MPVEMEWAGWRADTFTLQRNGWELSAEQDVSMQMIQIAARHRQLGFRLLSGRIPWEYYADMRFDRGSIPTIPVAHIAGDIRVREVIMSNAFGLSPIDAQPRLREAEPKSLDDYAHFAPAVADKQLYVPQETADDLMKRILDMQQDARIERIKNNIREGDKLREQKLYANVISLAA
nr:hypothetical protein [uncultured Cohaesibacter sp.]